MSISFEYETPYTKNRQQRISKSEVDVNQCFSSTQINSNSQPYVRIRQSSFHPITLEVQQLQKRQQLESRSNKFHKQIDIFSTSTIPTLKSKESDVFFKAKLQNQLHTRFKKLMKQSDPLAQQQAQKLDYVTFRMVKQRQKHHLKSLRASLMPPKGSTKR